QRPLRNDRAGYARYRAPRHRQRGSRAAERRNRRTPCARLFFVLGLRGQPRRRSRRIQRRRLVSHRRSRQHGRGGNVLLRGRTKDLINRGGVKFNPIDMEIAIAGHPAVAQVAIAPIPDEVLGERASCFVVLKNGASLSFEELTAFLRERQFAKFTWPEQLAIVTDMPVTPTRKVMKAELVRRILRKQTPAKRRSAHDMSLPLPLPESRAHRAYPKRAQK